MAGGFRSRFWKPSLDEEVHAELAFHVEMRTRELVERGWSEAAARDEALRRFGDLDKVRTRCRDIGSRRDRDMVRKEYFDELRQDIVFAVRQLVKNPGFAAVAILTLALGIGATTAIFSVVHAVVLRPLPFADPEKLVALNEEWRGRPGDVSAGNYTDTVAEKPSPRSDTRASTSPKATRRSASSARARPPVSSTCSTCGPRTAAGSAPPKISRDANRSWC